MKVFSLLFLLFIFCSQVTFGQSDTTKKFNYWSPATLGFRTALGFEKTMYVELGLSYHKAGGDIVAPVGKCVYASIEIIPAILPVKSNNLIGFKGGFELAGHLTVGGAEVKYLTDFVGREDIIITPRIGLGIWTMFGIMYGYNIPVKSTFGELGLHQISLIVNIDRLLTKGF